MQNESVDDELEHFEDVIEETEKETAKEPVTVANKQSDTVLVQNGDVANSDTDSAGSEDDDHPASSEEDDDDDGDALEDVDFLLAKSKTKRKKSKSVSADNEVQQSQESTNKPLLPGGYDPRHREPSYW